MKTYTYFIKTPRIQDYQEEQQIQGKDAFLYFVQKLIRRANIGTVTRISSFSSVVDQVEQQIVRSRSKRDMVTPRTTGYSSGVRYGTNSHNEEKEARRQHRLASSINRQTSYKPSFNDPEWKNQWYLNGEIWKNQAGTLHPNF